MGIDPRPVRDSVSGRTVVFDIGSLSTVRCRAPPAGRDWVIGDTVHDMEMARAANVRGVAVTYGVDNRSQHEAGPAEFVADSFDQVVDHLVVPPTCRPRA